MSITDGYELIDPTPYADQGAPHDILTKLRATSPVHRCEPKDYPPFWAITKHADICAMSKNPDDFLSDPGITLQRNDIILDRNEGLGAMKVIIEMDPPAHRKYRKVASPYFTQRALNQLNDAIESSARKLVDMLAGETGEGECDFAMDIAVAHPLRILSTILGVPPEDEPRILELTNQLFAPEDEELGRDPDADPNESIMKLGAELYELFSGIIEDRRANPRDDLASLIANGLVDGEQMGPMETFGYYLITFTAGHDTTKNSMAGGMRALIENPDEFAKLQADPSLIHSAVEEIVRWVTPVNYMKRTAARDTQVGDQKIAAGDELIMFYASGNRDEEVFDAPFEFHVDRNPNRHVGFGYGEHFCLGAHLARRSQAAIFGELARRIEHIELAGEPEWIKSSFVVGLKHLPIRYRIARRD